ncbi:MAG: S46 family peptidase [Bacteroidota bacterium]|nr:S46 family peptidase [Bacteroidota bacterium]MDX5429463.1 S46 family peptidase [Bacteroidota bacterium]MDX5468255.1 S46 family peptidase [Bacteroidota bacterium]
MYMKRIFTSLVAFLTMLSSWAGSFDEGMWLPILLKDYNYAEMQRLGLKLTPEQIYSANQAAMKDAIVWFGGFCTGEIISDKGLVLTNHHCGYDAIADLSTTQDNILDNGFFAKSLEQERPVEGLWAAVLVRMEDVSARILPEIQGLGDTERKAKIEELIAKIEGEVTSTSHYKATVKGIFNDNQFILFVMERFTDVRLVGTPPQNIGKYGGDTDNWMWPRHTGDFSMFRIYSGKDNMPAPYSADNKPYTPKHSLPVSLKGVQEGDFSMVFGYPGRTNRYATSFELEIAINQTNPAIVELRDARLKLMMEEMKQDDSLRLLLSSRYAQIANYWKYFIGQTEQLKRLKIVDEKKAIETRFEAWAQGKPEYAEVLNNLRQAHNTYASVALQPIYLNEGIFASGTALNAYRFSALEGLLTDKTKKEELAAAITKYKAMVPGMFESYNVVVDQNIMAATLYLYYKNIPAEQHPALIGEILKKYKKLSPEEAFKAYAADAFKKTMFSNPANLMAFLDNPSAKKLTKDPVYQYATAFYTHYMANYRTQVNAYNATKSLQMRTYVKGLMEMDPKMVQYPDANSTLRLTYGTVQSYQPKDAVHYSFYTTIEGIMEKYVPGDYEFDLPTGLIDLYNTKNYGQYANAKGELPVGFITNNDITGGNSGSPVINGNGELIGLAFDGNWEAMSGDIVFDPKYKRCINVDIRYVLFIIDKYHGATNIINELNLVK